MKILLLSFLIYTAKSLGQDAQPEKQEKSRSIKVLHIKDFGPGPRKAYLVIDKKSHLLALSGANFSRSISVPNGTEKISLSVNGVNGSEKLDPKAPSIRLPKDIGQYYLIILTDKKNPFLPLKMTLIENKKENVKIGGMLWVNLTPHLIKAKLGVMSVDLPANSEVVCGAPAETSSTFLASFDYQKRENMPYKTIMSKSWWYDATGRQVGFIHGTIGSLPRIFMVRDK